MTSLQPRSSRSNAPDRPVASSSSTSPRVFPSTASVASIPIPHANREPSPYPSQSLRSPSSSSFPYRPHLYSRQPSNPQQPPPVPPPPPSEPINLPRIHLPRPNSAARLTVGVGGDTPPLSSRALDSPSWCGESSRNAPPPGVYRTLSDSARGLNLPPLQFTSSSGAAPSQPRNPPARMPPPPLSPGRGTSSQVSPRIYNPPPPSALRPTYAGYEPPQTGRWKDDPYELRSPPLRGLPRSYSPERYAPPHYYAPPQASSSRARTGRSRSQSTASRRSEEAVESVSREVGAGPNRRMAHLMSEQKRRESINSGFAALRTAFPSSIPTDSKAIILRKAVLHINHLEGLLRDAGIGYAGPPTPTRGDWGEEDVKEDVEMAEGGEGSCRDRERERERGEDVRPRRGS